MAEGIEGLLRDKTRKPGKPPLAPDTIQRVVALGPPPRRGHALDGRGVGKGRRGELADRE